MADKIPMVSLTVRVDADLYALLDEKRQQEGTTIQQVANALLRQWAEGDVKTPKANQHQKYIDMLVEILESSDAHTAAVAKDSLSTFQRLVRVERHPLKRAKAG